MDAKTARRLKLGFALVMTAGCVGLALWQFLGLRKSGADDYKVWFYDPVAQRLYAQSREVLPPDETRGSPDNPGVLAVVVAFGDGGRDAAKRRIAYLEKYTPEFKCLLEGIRAARAGNKPFKGKMPGKLSGYAEDNTLVRRLAEAEWHAASSSEGRRIVSEWRAWRGPEGQLPETCAP